MDNLTKEQRKLNMSRIRSENTIPERVIMRELKRRKIYFSTHDKHLIGKPDIVFRKKRVVVFIDSDFWHLNPKKFIMPKSNKRYWKLKIENNQKRDKKVNKELKKAGWKVIRIWESDIKSNVDKCINKILRNI